MAPKVFTPSIAEAGINEISEFITELVYAISEAFQRADREARRLQMAEDPTTHIRGQLRRIFKSDEMEKVAERYKQAGLVHSVTRQRYDGLPFRSAEIVTSLFRFCFVSRDIFTDEVAPNQRHRRLASQAAVQTELTFPDIDEVYLLTENQLTALITCKASKEEPGLLEECYVEFIHGDDAEACWAGFRVDLLAVAKAYLTSKQPAVESGASLVEDEPVLIEKPKVQYRPAVRTKKQKNG